jgi:hypothetical protein
LSAERNGLAQSRTLLNLPLEQHRPIGSSNLRRNYFHL